MSDTKSFSDKINRPIIEQLEMVERDIALFRAYRHLWAKDVANHVKCELTRETLEAEQLEALKAALSHAYTIAQMLGIEWVKCEISRDELHKRLWGNKP